MNGIEITLDTTVFLEPARPIFAPYIPLQVTQISLPNQEDSLLRELRIAGIKIRKKPLRAIF